MSLDSRDQSIITQVAAKIAADLAVAAGGDVKIEDLVSDWAVALPTVAEALFEQIVGKQAEAAFPGSTPVVGWQPADFHTATHLGIPAPAGPIIPQGPYQAAPAPIPNVSDGDPATAQMWLELQTNPSDWYDNRTSKKNPRGPDFKNRRDGDKALWIVGKSNPSWVPQLVAGLRF